MYRCNLEDQKHLSYLKNVTKYTSEYVQNCYTVVVDQLNTTDCTFDGELTMPLETVKCLVNNLPVHRQEKIKAQRNQFADVRHLCHELAYVITDVVSNRTKKRKEQQAKRNAKASAKYKADGTQKIRNAKTNAKAKANGNAKRWNAKFSAKAKANGNQKRWNAKTNAKYNAKTSAARVAANVAALEACKDHPEPTYNPETLDAIVNKAGNLIQDFYGGNGIGFLHVFVGNYAKDGKEWTGDAMRLESMLSSSRCYGGRPSVVTEDGQSISYKKLLKLVGSDNLQVLPIYTGFNPLNCDTIEKMLQTKFMGLTEEQRLFRRAGAGSCKGRRLVTTPFPYYCGLLLCKLSMSEVGLRPGTESDRNRKRKR